MARGRIAFYLIALVTLSGCSSMLVKDASTEEDSKAKQFAPDSANAIVYFFRDDAFLGGDMISNVFVGDKSVAEGARNRFTVLSAPPGHYSFTVLSNDVGALPGLLHNVKKPALEVTLEGGSIYFVHVKWEGYRGFFLHSTTKDIAEPIIIKGKLISKRQS